MGEVNGASQGRRVPLTVGIEGSMRMFTTQPIDTSTFERLHGERPWQVLDRHPDGRHAALQVIASLETTANRAGVWDLTTGLVRGNTRARFAASVVEETATGSRSWCFG